MKSFFFLLIVALFSASKVHANEAMCLSKIIYAEARGETFPQIVKLGQAAMTKADDDDTNICELRGVQRKHVPNELKPYYLAISKELISNPSQSLSKGANRWKEHHGDNLFRKEKRKTK